MAGPYTVDACRPPSAPCGVGAGPTNWTALSTWQPLDGHAPSPNRTSHASRRPPRMGKRQPIPLLPIMIKYWVHHNNGIAFLSIVLGVLLLCYIEVSARGLTYNRIVWAQSPTWRWALEPTSLIFKRANFKV